MFGGAFITRSPSGHFVARNAASAVRTSTLCSESSVFNSPPRTNAFSHAVRNSQMFEASFELKTSMWPLASTCSNSTSKLHGITSLIFASKHKNTHFASNAFFEFWLWFLRNDSCHASEASHVRKTPPSCWQMDLRKTSRQEELFEANQCLLMYSSSKRCHAQLRNMLAELFVGVLQELPLELLFFGDVLG